MFTYPKSAIPKSWVDCINKPERIFNLLNLFYYIVGFFLYENIPILNLCDWDVVRKVELILLDRHTIAI